ncbi:MULTISPECIES: type II toxin-antitoxin system VapC family toxin [unclassified Arcicella]|uniref:type II toxin-antitoxin system VapC family toxin n=1 Tax=unclassified Arcicella TaxID=2644986 RepID=UPI0028659B27|nr:MULTISPECIES: type II toxin-antitoxin system VapC family toxin [unclassified Arcicella]MDR6559981.1 putative nucleic acid-binding protein [Arcicella sp. BE51]MDR6810412.1 putative nucleic acid-binding protein [Arcicella sp. BE140]MDR6821762.1 putative nucleic acid-binding protein [Arcicella sp. BE139]
MILIDTSILIEYFRKQHKNKTLLFKLFSENESLAISVITKYELLIGSNQQQDLFWEFLLQQLTVISLDEAIIDETISIKKELKVKNNEIGLANMIIAAKARFNDFELATLNINHFNKVNRLRIVRI